MAYFHSIEHAKDPSSILNNGCVSDRISDQRETVDTIITFFFSSPIRFKVSDVDWLGCVSSMLQANNGIE